MPEQRPPLPRDGEVVRVTLATLYRALCHINRPISPSTSQLPYSMPAPRLKIKKHYDAGRGSIVETRKAKMRAAMAAFDDAADDMVLDG